MASRTQPSPEEQLGLERIVFFSDAVIIVWWLSPLGVLLAARLFAKKGNVGRAGRA